MYNNPLNESSTFDYSYSNEDIILKLGEINIYDENKKSYIKMKPDDIIKVCNDALYKMQRDYPYLYLFLNKCKIMYIPIYPSEVCDTMAVDPDSNMWINMSFVYNSCKMNTDRVFGIIFHEMFHIFFDHCVRFFDKYPEDMFKGMPGAYERANMKANICMDYEVNSSMVEDGVVTADFFKVMNGFYKKEYTGLTWEEILDKYGDAEYKAWLSRNGKSLDDLELKIFEAIEKASKVLLDNNATDEEKRGARKQLQKTLDKLLGKQDRGEKSIQDMVEDLQNSKLGDIGDIALDMDDVIDDLYKDPSGMSGEELDKTLNDIDKLMDNITDSADEVASQFNKTADEVTQDAQKARDSFKDAMKKINEGGMSNDEKADLIQKAKDDLEDIIADDAEKEKLKKKREERDAKKAAERLEKFKKNHPFRKLIVVLKNLAGLDAFNLVSEDTIDLLNKCVDELEPLTELKFDDMKKSQFKKLSNYFDDLTRTLLVDLVELINNETILNKTEDDMKRLVDGVFEHVYNAIRRIFDNTIDNDAKASLVKMAASKLRIIGKVLKTQKVWKVSDEFKEAYMGEMKRLMDIIKKSGDKELFRELCDFGVIEPWFLDENGKKLWDELQQEGSLEDVAFSDWEPAEEFDAYEGKVYYWLKFDGGEGGTTRMVLSDNPNGPSKNYREYIPLEIKFLKDFPEYELDEEMEAMWNVWSKSDTSIAVAVEEIEEKLKNHPDYKPGNE